MDNNDIRNIKNVRERQTKELMKEYKAKEKEQKEISKLRKEASKEEKRRTQLSELQQKRSEQKAKLQEQISIQKQKAEIKRLKQETGLIGKAQKLQKQIKFRQLAMQKKVPKANIKSSTTKSKTYGKIYIVKGIPYHYKGGKLVKVPVGKTKSKKKKEEWSL